MPHWKKDSDEKNFFFSKINTGHFYFFLSLFFHGRTIGVRKIGSTGVKSLDRDV